VAHSMPPARGRAHDRVWAVAGLAALALMLGLIVPTVASSGARASASTWTGPARIVSSQGAHLDWCPGNASICQDNLRVTVLPPNTAVTMVCWLDARTPSGFSTPRWFYVKSGSAQGFVKAELVTNQQPLRPWCWDNASQPDRAVAASLEATGTSEIYQTQPTAADQYNAAKQYGFHDWGTPPDWSGDCVMFVALSWWRAGKLMHTVSSYPYTAAHIATTYALNPGTNPPRGAAVFWGGGAGHVAISLGNGMMVTTQGTDGQFQPTTNKWLSQMGAGMTYLGWTPTP